MNTKHKDKNKLHVRYNVLLTTELKKVVSKYADIENMNFSDYVRHCLREHIEKKFKIKLLV